MLSINVPERAVEGGICPSTLQHIERYMQAASEKRRASFSRYKKEACFGGKASIVMRLIFMLPRGEFS
ncbi:hypothetical protein [Pseudochelatococcus contaminans]|uniref:hypothetical protein n=1 Tax=Pseudochelatococcus contaminans TaxID=1538103 RepID=UPI00161B5AD8|nr:hypothetical protein [Pseudochelatococcus contaminans]